MKLISRLIKHMNAYTNQIIQLIFLIHIQSNQNTLKLKENNNVLENFGFYKNKKSTLEEQNIKEDYRNLVSKSLDIKLCIKNNLLGYIS